MKRRFIFDTIIIVGCIVVIFFGAEGYVRFVADDGMQYDLEMWKYARDVKKVSKDPLIGHEHAPNRQATLMGVDFRTNSKGLRDREIDYQRSSNKLRILMLGDSMTVGWGTSVEQTFAKRIERLYAEKGVDAEVINTGVGNYNTIQEVQYFLTEGKKYQPNVVVLNFSFNDAEPVPVDRPPSFVLRNCYSCIFVLGRVDTLMRKLSVGKEWDDYYLSLYGDGNAIGWLQAKESIGKLAAYCHANGMALLIVNLPELHDVQNYRFQIITDLVRKAADQYGAEFVDILPYLKGHKSSLLWVTPPDPHPNALAHESIARGIFDELQKMNLGKPNSHYSSYR